MTKVEIHIASKSTVTNVRPAFSVWGITGLTTSRPKACMQFQIGLADKLVIWMLHSLWTGLDTMKSIFVREEESFTVFREYSSAQNLSDILLSSITVFDDRSFLYYFMQVTRGVSNATSSPAAEGP